MTVPIIIILILIIIIGFYIMRSIFRKTETPLELYFANKVVFSNAKEKDLFSELKSSTSHHLPFITHENIRVLEGEYGDKEYYEIAIKQYHVLGLSITLKSATNISEYIHLNESITTEKNQFEELYNNSFHFIGLLSNSGILLRANDTSLKAIHATRESVIGSYFWETPWWQHSHHEQEHLKTAIQEASKGNLYRFETNHQSADGPMIEIDLILRPLLDDKNNVNYIIAEGHDITALKSTERVLKLNQQRLLALENLSFMEWESINDLNITILNTCIQLTESSYGFYSVLDNQGIIGPITCYNKIKTPVTTPDIINEFNSFINDLSLNKQIRNKRDILFDNDLDYYGDLGLIITRYIAIPVILEEDIIGIVWVINKTNPYDEYDIRQLSLLVEEGTIIVERNLLRARMAKSNQELEEKVKARTVELQKSMNELVKTQNQLLNSERLAATGHLIMNVSHQLNTPIGISVTALSYLSTELKDFKEKYQDVDCIDSEDIDSLESPVKMISESLTTASNWIDKLKLISDIRLSGSVKEIVLKEFIQNIYDRLLMDTKSEGIDLSLFISNDLILHVDSHHYELMFRELLENSMIHGFNQRRNKKIHITCSVIENDLKIAYDDNGKGMDIEKLNNLVHHNFSENEKKKPWGLGLQTLISTVEKYLNGSISMDSEIDKGFSCIITLPIKQKKD